MKYFAYGSNMSERRMIKRKVKFLKRYKGILKDYKLIINKKSYKNPNMGYSNIIYQSGNNVEGIIYEIMETDILKLDKFEGYPKHYDRVVIDINVDNKIEKCIVYISQKEWVTNEELKTSNEYKNYLLDGKDLLSEKYYERLKNIKTLD